MPEGSSRNAIPHLGKNVLQVSVFMKKHGRVEKGNRQVGIGVNTSDVLFERNKLKNRATVPSLSSFCQFKPTKVHCSKPVRRSYCHMEHTATNGRDALKHGNVVKVSPHERHTSRTLHIEHQKIVEIRL